jgi:hypothetical protein
MLDYSERFARMAAELRSRAEARGDEASAQKCLEFAAHFERLAEDPARRQPAGDMVGRV